MEEPYGIPGSSRASEVCYNLVILETIFDNLDFSDLKSASLVCKTWSLGATKAFEQKANPTIESASSAAALSHGLERFRRHKQLTLNFNDKPDGNVSSTMLNSKQNLNFLTRLDMHFEGSVATVTCINEILGHLTSGYFPQLHQLELHPYGDTVWDSPPEVLPVPTNSSNGHEVTSALPTLQVLKVAVGHASSLGLDWNFLKYLTKLKELHAVDVNFKEGNFGPQLQRFANFLGANAPFSRVDLFVGILSCNARNYSRRHPSDSVALRNFLDAMNPSNFSLILQTYYSEKPASSRTWFLKVICSKLSAASLSRLAVQLPICGYETSKDAYASMFFIVHTLYQTYLQNTKMTVLVTLHVDFGNHGRSFVELEGKQSGLCLRYGSLLDRCKLEGPESLSIVLAMAWCAEGSRPSLDTLRTYRFDKDGSVDRSQYHTDFRAEWPFWDSRIENPWEEVEFTEPRLTWSPPVAKMNNDCDEMSLCEYYTTERFF